MGSSELVATDVKPCKMTLSVTDGHDVVYVHSIDMEEDAINSVFDCPSIGKLVWETLIYEVNSMWTKDKG